MKTLKNFYLTMYKLFGFVFLVSIIVIVFTYGGNLLFYATNNSWIAPTILNATDRKVLQFEEKMLTAKQHVSETTNKLEIARLEQDDLNNRINSMNKHLGELEHAIEMQITTNHQISDEVQPLIEEKDKTLDSMLYNANRLTRNSKKHYKRGLITKNEWITSVTHTDTVKAARLTGVIQNIQLVKELQMSNNNDSVEMVNLRGNILTAKEIISKLSIERVGKLASISEMANRLKDLKSIQENLSKNSLYLATTDNKTTLAFVPYDHEDNVYPGAPLYDCYVGMVGCYNVGEVVKIFNEEETGFHPIFKHNIRGFLVELDIKDDEKPSAKSKVLFVNGRPLFI